MKARGFTLLEVMLGLALLGFGLTVLIKSAAGSMRAAGHSQMIGVATDLSRSKMNDIEEMLIKDGFTDTDQSEGECGDTQTKKRISAATKGVFEPQVTGEEIVKQDREDDAELRARRGKPFEDEGWPNVYYAYKVETVELPSWEDLQALAQQRGSGSGSATGSDGEEEGGFQDSTLGSMLSQLGGGFGGDPGAGVDDKAGAAFIQGYYSMIQQVLKVSIRKVSLCVTYDVMGSSQMMKTVAYFTDAQAMDKVIGGLGAQPGSGSGSGSGSGTGSGTGSGSSGTGGTGGRPGRGSGGGK